MTDRKKSKGLAVEMRRSDALARAQNLDCARTPSQTTNVAALFEAGEHAMHDAFRPEAEPDRYLGKTRRDAAGEVDIPAQVREQISLSGSEPYAPAAVWARRQGLGGAPKLGARPLVSGTSATREVLRRSRHRAHAATSRGGVFNIIHSAVMSGKPFSAAMSMSRGQYSGGIRFAIFHCPTRTGGQGIASATTLFPPS